MLRTVGKWKHRYAKARKLQRACDSQRAFEKVSAFRPVVGQIRFWVEGSRDESKQAIESKLDEARSS